MLALFWAAISHQVYVRTLPHHLIERVFGESSDEGPFAITTLLRKLYSIVAFTLVGFVVHKALPRARRPALRAALIVAAFSAAIEVAQKQRDGNETLLSNAIDIACGAFGGWLAVWIDRALRKMFAR